jgi:galactose mutarotase-like enzyme
MKSFCAFVLQGMINKNEGFPFRYTTEVIYTLTANNNLSIQTIVTNTSNSEMPVERWLASVFQIRRNSK